MLSQRSAGVLGLRLPPVVGAGLPQRAIARRRRAPVRPEAEDDADSRSWLGGVSASWRGLGVWDDLVCGAGVSRWAVPAGSARSPTSPRRGGRPGRESSRFPGGRAARSRVCVHSGVLLPLRRRFGAWPRSDVMVVAPVPPQRETVNPVRPGREQPQRWMRVPGCGWRGPPPSRHLPFDDGASRCIGASPDSGMGYTRPILFRRQSGHRISQ